MELQGFQRRPCTTTAESDRDDVWGAPPAAELGDCDIDQATIEVVEQRAWHSSPVGSQVRASTGLTVSSESSPEHEKVQV